MMLQRKIAMPSQIANLVRATASASAAGATPLRGHRERTGNATPGGGTARKSLSPSLRPHACISGLPEVCQ